MRRTRWEQTKEDIFHSTSLFFTINDFSGKTKTFTIPSFASCDIQLNEEISVSLGLESDLKYSRSSYKHSHFCWVFELISQSFYETFMLKIFYSSLCAQCQHKCPKPAQLCKKLLQPKLFGEISAVKRKSFICALLYNDAFVYFANCLMKYTSVVTL